MRDSRRHARQFQNTYPQMFPDRKVKTVTFIVTHQCNLRCTYCYEHNKSDRKMDLETAKKCVDLLFAEDAQNSELVNQTGGPEGGRTTKYTIAPGNVALFADAVRHLVLVEGVETLNCNCVYEEGWTVEHARELYRQLKETSDMLRESGTNTYVSILDWEAGNPLPDTDTQNWCGGDGRMLSFDVDGTVLPCMRYSSISIDSQPLYRIGDINSGIARREDDARRLATLRRITRQSQSEPRCLQCPIASGCAWCTAYNYERTGTPDKRVTYICDMHKARVLAQCYHHNRLHLQNPDHAPKKMHIPREWAVELVGAEEYAMLLELERQALIQQEEERK